MDIIESPQKVEEILKEFRPPPAYEPFVGSFPPAKISFFVRNNGIPLTCRHQRVEDRVHQDSVWGSLGTSPWPAFIRSVGVPRFRNQSRNKGPNGIQDEHVFVKKLPSRH